MYRAEDYCEREEKQVISLDQNTRVLAHMRYPVATVEKLSTRLTEIMPDIYGP